MPDWEKLTASLTKHGFTVDRFATGAEAAAFIDGHIDGKTVGFGGSMTLKELGLYELLSVHNTVYSHTVQGPSAQVSAAGAQIYLASVNGLAETGELINIDGHGNRMASTIYGHEEVWFVVGINKIAPDFEKALWRARNIASPKNAQRLGKRLPARSRGTNAMTATALSASVGWSPPTCASPPPSPRPTWYSLRRSWVTKQGRGGSP